MQRALSLLRPALLRSVVVPRPQFARAYASAGGALSKADIETRVMGVLKGFDKVDPAKVG